MLALTKLTNPGPFAPRTIDFGHYYGVFDGDKLVAMAGQRLHIHEYTEIKRRLYPPGLPGQRLRQAITIEPYSPYAGSWQCSYFTCKGF